MQHSFHASFVVLFLILVTIVMLNLLIAYISDSFARVKVDEANVTLRNLAMLIVEVEKQLPTVLLDKLVLDR